MNDHEQRWQRVGAAINQRITQLDTSMAELERDSGISFKTLKRYIAGNPIVRVDKRRELTKALEWTSDSIDRLLAGNEPVEVQSPRPIDPATMQLPDGTTVSRASFTVLLRTFLEAEGSTTAEAVAKTLRLLKLMDERLDAVEATSVEERVEVLERQVASLQNVLRTELLDDDAETEPALDATDAEASTD